MAEKPVAAPPKTAEAPAAKPAVAQPIAQPQAAVSAAPSSPASSPVVVAAAVEDYHRKRVMAGKEPKAKPLQGFGVTVTALNNYGRYFDHPGFKPIATGH